MPAIIEIEVDQGADFLSELFTWTDANGAPQNLNGATAALAVRTANDNTSTLLLSGTQGAGVILGGMAGTIQFSFAAADTEVVPPGQYFLTLILTPGVGAWPVTMYLVGTVNVRGSTV